MKWYQYLGYFISGVGLANTIPHLVNGISGKEFRTPFANPSTPTLNVLWGLFNLIVGMGILIALRGLPWKFDRRWVVLTIGFVFMAVNLSFVFSQK